MWLKNFGFAVVLAMLNVTLVQGQDTYEYASLFFLPGLKIEISMVDQDHRVIELPPKRNQPKGTSADFTPALEQLTALSQEGWEVFSTQTWGSGAGFYLRRRKE